MHVKETLRSKSDARKTKLSQGAVQLGKTKDEGDERVNCDWRKAGRHVFVSRHVHTESGV